MSLSFPAPPVPAHVAHAHELVRRLGEPLLGGNHAEVLADARAARADQRLHQRGARDHINLDAALLEVGEAQDGLLHRLVALCRQGVRVQVLAANPRQEAELGPLRRAGATVRILERPGGLSGWVAQRFQSMQRQLAVVDGRTAWCGPGSPSTGAGAQGPHLRVRGPIVQRVQRLFLDGWKTAEPRLPAPPPQHFPPIALAGRQRMGIATRAGSAQPAPAAGCPLIGAVETARFSVFIALARRAPSRRLVQAIASAAGRGVNVSVLLQHGGAPHAWPWRASCAELMRAGAWLYQADGSQPLPAHSTVDGVWSSVAIDGGSGWHSGDVIDAAQLLVLDAAFASELDDVCQAAMAHALLLDAHSLAGPAPLRRWFGPTAPARAPVADHSSLTSVGRSVEGPGLSP